MSLKTLGPCSHGPVPAHNAPVHKQGPWFANVGMEELKWLARSLDLNPIEHLWDETGMLTVCQTSSVPDLTNALATE